MPPPWANYATGSRAGKSVQSIHTFSLNIMPEMWNDLHLTSAFELL